MTETVVKEQDSVMAEEKEMPAPAADGTLTKETNPMAAPEEEESDVWGRLESQDERYPSIDLRGEEGVTVGRTVEGQGLGAKGAVSGRHCRVWREAVGAAQQVYVEDTSTNGTFVDGARLRRGVRHMLASGAEVALLDPRKAVDAVVYRFVELAAERAERAQGGPQRDYELGPVLGRGHFATVRRAVCRADGRPAAVKIIEKARAATASRRPGASLRDEAQILLDVHHANIVAVRGVYETARYYYIVLELVTGGELFDRIVAAGHFAEAAARRVAAQVLDALAYLHARGIAHRDLKPENILLAAPGSDTVKITDFGLSRVVDEGSFMRTMVGTPAYVAPEVLASRGSGGYTPAVDLWSLGVITYVMLCGFQPFDASDTDTLFRRIRAGAYDFPAPYWTPVSPLAKDFVRALMTVDPAARLTAVQALQHPWIRGSDSLEIAPPSSKRPRTADPDDGS